MCKSKILYFKIQYLQGLGHRSTTRSMLENTKIKFRYFDLIFHFIFADLRKAREEFS